MTRPTWEYRVVSNYRHLDDRELAVLGDDGWELVVVSWKSGTPSPRYIFKRMAQENV